MLSNIAFMRLEAHIALGSTSKLSQRYRGATQAEAISMIVSILARNGHVQRRRVEHSAAGTAIGMDAEIVFALAIGRVRVNWDQPALGLSRSARACGHAATYIVELVG